MQSERPNNSVTVSKMTQQPTALQMLAMKAAVKSAFGGTFFNVCGVVKAAALLGKDRATDAQDWELIHAVHCVNWAEFDDAARNELMTRIARVLGMSVLSLSSGV